MELPRIFERFYRGRGDGEASSGLGLAIVKRVAELHDVPIEVDSRLAAGTRFVLRVPAAAAGGGGELSAGA